VGNLGSYWQIFASRNLSYKNDVKTAMVLSIGVYLAPENSQVPTFLQKSPFFCKSRDQAAPEHRAIYPAASLSTAIGERVQATAELQTCALSRRGARLGNMTYSYHTWKDVLEDIFLLGRSKATYIAVAKQYKIGVRTVVRWLTKFDHHGTSCPIRKRAKQGFSCLEPAHTEFILEILARVPIAYPEELADLLALWFHVNLHDPAGPRCSGPSKFHQKGAGVQGDGAE
jgi:hypothetical protein